MRVVRWTLAVTIALLGILWAAALTSTPGSAGVDDLGRGIVVASGFAAGHVPAFHMEPTRPLPLRLGCLGHGAVAGSPARYRRSVASPRPTRSASALEAGPGARR